MTYTLDIEQARELLRQAVIERGPDFVYNPGGNGICYYTPQLNLAPGKPQRVTGCVAGTVLFKADLPSRLLLELIKTNHGAHSYSAAVEGNQAQDLSDDWAKHVSADVGRYLRTAQVSQDGGATWGQAYRAAEYGYSRRDQNNGEVQIRHSVPTDYVVRLDAERVIGHDGVYVKTTVDDLSKPRGKNYLIQADAAAEIHQEAMSKLDLTDALID